MKKFLIRFSITLVCLLAISTALDIYISSNLHQSEARIFKSWNDIFYGSLHCDALIMGNSRGLMQFSPAILDNELGTNFYNISVDGRAIDAEVVKYKTYRLFSPKPRLIIQNVDWGTLSLSNGYETEQFLPYLHCDSLYRMTRESEGFSIGDKHLPLVRYAGYLQVIKEGLGLNNKLDKPVLFKGYCARDNSWDGSMFDKVTTVDFCHDEKPVNIFESYLQQCRDEGVQVVLVLAPIYIGVTEKMDNPQEMFDYFDAIGEKYDCPVLNYTLDPISCDTAYFYNATHLNKTGAELFSTKLANDLDSLRTSGILNI